jgi:CubicO group peptidase (beta-lactamase class C family)
MDNSPNKNSLYQLLGGYTKSVVPGIQYVVVDTQRVIFEYAGGWADIRNQKPMKPNTTQMAYSMTKTLTAAAVLQLVEKGELKLDDGISRYLQNPPYDGNITIRQLVCHTSGIPNPIPLKWVHIAEDDERFSEKPALARVLRDNPKLRSEPGEKYAYSNIGYWLLGKIIEEVTQHSYTDYMRDCILRPLGLEIHEMDFVVHDPSGHAKGYLGKYSLMNLLRGWIADRKVWGQYEDNWVHVKSHYVNGPAFGGLIGAAQAFSRFLQDELRESSVLFGIEAKQLFYAQHQVFLQRGWWRGIP